MADRLETGPQQDFRGRHPKHADLESTDRAFDGTVLLDPSGERPPVFPSSVRDDVRDSDCTGSASRNATPTTESRVFTP